MANYDSTPNTDKIIASAQGANANPPTGDDGLYFPVPIAAAQDTELSFEALGVLTYLLSKPEDWRVVITDLCQKCGREKVYRILRELEERGYVERAAALPKTVIGHNANLAPLESHLENWITTHKAAGVAQLSAVILARQFRVPSGRVDLVWQELDGTIVIAELKRGELDAKSLVQILRYTSDFHWMWRCSSQQTAVIPPREHIRPVLIGASIRSDVAAAAAMSGVEVFLYQVEDGSFTFSLLPSDWYIDQSLDTYRHFTYGDIGNAMRQSASMAHAFDALFEKVGFDAYGGNR